MAFQIKSFVSITASMLNRMRLATQVVTDFTVGSGVRTALEAVAQEIEELYRQIAAAVAAAIPVAIYNGFSFPPLAAIASSGLVRVVVAPPTTTLTIAAGTTFTAAAGGNLYTSTADATIAIGASFVDVPVVASTAGAASNLAAGTAFVLSTVPAGFVSAQNAVAFTNGSDAETDDARQIRFQGYVSTLSRGTNAALAYGASTTALTNGAGAITEQVKIVDVVTPLFSTTAPIFVYPVVIYVHNGTGGTSAALVAQCQTIINGYTNAAGVLVPGFKAAGTPTTVEAATEQDLAVAATVFAAAGYTSADLVAPVETAISTYLTGLTIGASAIVAEIVAVAMAVPGVSDFQMTAPMANAAAGTGIKIMPGAYTIAGG